MFYIVFNAVTVVSLVILFFILFLRKGFINKILSLIILCPVLSFIHNIIILSGHIYQFPYFAFLSFFSAAFIGPMVYLYCRLLMGKKLKISFPLHFLSLGLLLLTTYFWIRFYGLSPVEKYTYLSGLNSFIYPWELMLLNNIFTYLQLVYLLVAMVEVFKFKSISKDFFSDTEKIRLQYIVTFITLLFALTLILAVFYKFIPTREVEFFYIPFLVQVTFLYVVVFAFQKNAVFSFKEFSDLQCNLERLNNYEEFNEPLCVDLKQMTKENRLQLYNAEIESVYPILKNKLEVEKIYRDNNLSLSLMAEKTGVCAHTISAVIKYKFQSNFFDLVNAYRIDEIVKKLEKFDSSKQKIEILAYDAGFNSKSAFYRAFKKTFKSTPKEFMERLKKRV